MSKTDAEAAAGLLGSTPLASSECLRYRLTSRTNPTTVADRTGSSGAPVVGLVFQHVVAVESFGGVAGTYPELCGAGAAFVGFGEYRFA